ncbi:MAG: DUF6113 family protein [Actinomadura sp.]
MGEDENAPVGGVPEARPHGPDLPAAGPGGPVIGSGEPAPYRRSQAMVTGAAYGALAAFGIALGVLGSFLFPAMLGPIPIAALAFVAVNLVAMRLAGWGMGAKLGAVIPTVAWLIVVFSLSTTRAEGDLVITGTLPGYLFIVGGSIAAMIAVALTPSPRSWLLRGTGVDTPVR